VVSRQYNLYATAPSTFSQESIVDGCTIPPIFTFFGFAGARANVASAAAFTAVKVGRESEGVAAQLHGD